MSSSDSTRPGRACAESTPAKRPNPIRIPRPSRGPEQCSSGGFSELPSEVMQLLAVLLMLPDDIPRELRDGAPAVAIQTTYRQPEVVGAVEYVRATVVRAQTADHNKEVALCWQPCSAGDEMGGYMEKIDGLLGRGRILEAGRDDGGMACIS